MKSWSRHSWRYLIAILVAIPFILPLYWMAVSSLRQPGIPPSVTVEWLPKDARWSNYLELFHTLPMGRYTLNSLIVVATAVPITVVTASLAGFAMAQLPYRGRHVLVLTSVALLVIPGTAVWMFRYQILQWLGMVDTLWALIAPAFAASSPFFVLLYYWSYRRIPEEVYEAGRLEGAGALTLWRQLGMPLVHSTTTAVIILTTVMYWSDFTSPVLYIFDPRRYTLAVGLQILKQNDASNWPLMMAGAMFITLPVILLFMILQRVFLDNLSIANLYDRN